LMIILEVNILIFNKLLWSDPFPPFY
jgi:hypothetical protein